MNTLTFTSCQAASVDFVGEAMAAYVGRALGIATAFVGDIPWKEREARLDAGEIQIGWICGIPYVWRADEPDPQIELLVAPVMRGARYQDRPIYFSDVVVHQKSEFQTFNDLRHTTWAINEPGSHSGYYVTRHSLAEMGETSGFFDRVVEAGSHVNALQMILARKVDAAAIDTTVLETELRRNPIIQNHIRVIETFGPSPIPPWVIRREVPPQLRAAVREALARMHTDPHARSALQKAHIARFTPVRDADYDPVREMAANAENVSL